MNIKEYHWELEDIAHVIGEWLECAADILPDKAYKHLLNARLSCLMELDGEVRVTDIITESVADNFHVISQSTCDDVIKVVRCKECMHYNGIDAFGWCRRVNYFTHDNDYCSSAKLVSDKEEET